MLSETPAEAHSPGTPPCECIQEEEEESPAARGAHPVALKQSSGPEGECWQGGQYHASVVSLCSLGMQGLPRSALLHLEAHSAARREQELSELQALHGQLQAARGALQSAGREKAALSEQCDTLRAAMTHAERKADEARERCEAAEARAVEEERLRAAPSKSREEHAPEDCTNTHAVQPILSESRPAVRGTEMRRQGSALRIACACLLLLSLALLLLLLLQGRARPPSAAVTPAVSTADAREGTRAGGAGGGVSTSDDSSRQCAAELQAVRFSAQAQLAAARAHAEHSLAAAAAAAARARRPRGRTAHPWPPAQPAQAPPPRLGDGDGDAPAGLEPVWLEARGRLASPAKPFASHTHGPADGEL